MKRITKARDNVNQTSRQLRSNTDVGTEKLNLEQFTHKAKKQLRKVKTKETGEEKPGAALVDAKASFHNDDKTIEAPSELVKKKTSKRAHIEVEYDGDEVIKRDEKDIKVEKEEEIDETKMLVEQQDIMDDRKSQTLIDDTKIKTEVVSDDADIEDRKGKDIKMPVNWKAVLDNMREMRKKNDAPVDSMGCDQCMDDTANAKDKRYQALLSLMLSSQTKDQITHAAMQKLIEHGCTVENILKTPDEKISELIYPVGFYKTKVKYIRKSSEMIKEQFGGDIPRTLKDLCKLHGVGPKMAHLCMKTAWGEITGIGVDTHVHRISNRMGWVHSKTPEGTRTQLESWLPKELWSEVNHLLVGFGQQICLPVKPSCSTCLNRDICPFPKSPKSKVKKELKKEAAKSEVSD